LLELELPWEPMGSSPERGWRGKGKRERGVRLWGCGLPCSAAACYLLRAEREEGNRKEEGERIRKRKGRKRKEKKKGKNMEKFPNLKISEK
jgi:hypothetical protein